MTGDGIITMAKKRLKNASNSIDWNSIFAIVIDDLFTRKEWKFAQKTITFVQLASTFEKQFSANATEKALNHIKSIRYLSGTNSRELDYVPMQRFRTLYPDENEGGTPELYTELLANDGTNGMKIGIYPQLGSLTTFSIDGGFIPSYIIDTNPLPILPVQFHRLVFHGVVMHAADEAGQDKLSAKAERWYEMGIDKLDTWDIKNHKYLVNRKPYDDPSLFNRRGPFYPDNFPRRVGR